MFNTLMIKLKTKTHIYLCLSFTIILLSFSAFNLQAQKKATKPERAVKHAVNKRVFYGEASFQKGSDRATIRFTQISLPSGQIRKVSALALSKDGQPGVPGRVFSDGMKNTAGQVLTTFVGGLAAGSMAMKSCWKRST